jgi:hypothetical protein
MLEVDRRSDHGVQFGQVMGLGGADDHDGRPRQGDIGIFGHFSLPFSFAPSGRAFVLENNKAA